MKNRLTETQRKVFQGIASFIGERGYPPTIREIMNLFGYASVNNVQRILGVLENKGYIRRNYRGGARCIEITGGHSAAGDRIKQLPIVGQIAAGEPVFAEQNYDGYVTMDLGLIGVGGDFVLRVKGESMRDANIFDDDLIIVSRTNFPKNGDIIVALLDEEATVKKYFLEGNS
ncbi:MAG: transcriptional repressor LexA, partial [candidate division KSB1 bacterium]|nr:transcriptional repressor LexA [candidate division KSB1 bacterium]